jgi:hypothetical protein
LEPGDLVSSIFNKFEINELVGACAGHSMCWSTEKSPGAYAEEKEKKQVEIDHAQEDLTATSLQGRRCSMTRLSYTDKKEM